jgi:hypothetical protein
MNWIKQIDRYLLLNHPNIWITRIHYVLPATLLSALLIFVLYSTQQFRIDLEYPSTFSAVLILSIPVVVGFAFWLVFQARYNVMKSGGRHELGHNVLLFVVFLTVIWSFFIVLMAPIWGAYSSVKHAIPKAEVEQHKETLSKGFDVLLANYIRYDRTSERVYFENYSDKGTFIRDNSDDEMEYDEEDANWGEHYLTKKDFERILADFETVFISWTDPKYKSDFLVYKGQVFSNQDMPWEFRQLIARSLGNLNVVMGENYFSTGPYDYYRNPVRELQDVWFWRFWLTFFSYMAMLLVFFKLMQWRDFALGLLALLTNLFVTSIVLVMVGISGSGVSGMNAVLILMATVNVLLMVMGSAKEEKKWYAQLAAFSIAFYTPILVFIFALTYFESKPYGNIKPYIDQLYYACYLTGLICVVGFSYFFKRYWWLPSAK